MDIEKIIRDNLVGVIHMSLATSNNDKPWISELHFAYDKKLNFYFRSLPTRRHSLEITINPNVAGNVIKQHKLDEPLIGVYFEGKARVLNGTVEKRKAFECMKARLGIGEENLEESNRNDGHQFYEVKVDKFYIFGSFDGNPSQKYELEWNGGNIE